MAGYLILLYVDEAAYAAGADGTGDGALFAAHQKFAAEHADVLRGGGQLAPARPRPPCAARAPGRRGPPPTTPS